MLDSLVNCSERYSSKLSSDNWLPKELLKSKLVRGYSPLWRMKWLNVFRGRFSIGWCDIEPAIPSPLLELITWGSCSRFGLLSADSIFGLPSQDQFFFVFRHGSVIFMDGLRILFSYPWSILVSAAAECYRYTTTRVFCVLLFFIFFLSVMKRWWPTPLSL